MHLAESSIFLVGSVPEGVVACNCSGRVLRAVVHPFLTLNLADNARLCVVSACPVSMYCNLLRRCRAPSTQTARASPSACRGDVVSGIFVVVVDACDSSTSSMRYLYLVQ